MSVEIIACATHLNIKFNCLNFRVMHMQTHLLTHSMHGLEHSTHPWYERKIEVIQPLWSDPWWTHQEEVVALPCVSGRKMFIFG